MAQQRPVGAPNPGGPGVSVERGKYFVTVQDCNGCHTPFTDKGEPDLTKMLSGHPQNAAPITAAPKLPAGWVTAISTTNTAWSTPAGVAFTSNLTPDKETGIGAWTEDTFVKAIRNGKHFGTGRPLLPPMPWKMYANLTDDDLKSIFAYLKTVPPIKNKVPNPIMPSAAVK
jgi:mono/diheme cytochrome c family protein